jgi:hypothetical protein
MSLTQKIMSVAAACLALQYGVAHAGTVTLDPLRERTVSYVRFSDNWTNTPYAGNIAPPTIGSSIGVYRYYQEFLLPAYEAGTELTSAVLTYSYEGTSGGYPLVLYGTAGNWTAIDWYKQPAVTTGVLGQLPGGYSATVQIDITDYLNAIYQPNTSVGFLIRSPREGNIWHDAVELKERSLNLTFAPVAQVPEPASYAMILTGLALLGVTVGRRRRAGHVG